MVQSRQGREAIRLGGTPKTAFWTSRGRERAPGMQDTQEGDSWKRTGIAAKAKGH